MNITIYINCAFSFLCKWYQYYIFTPFINQIEQMKYDNVYQELILDAPRQTGKTETLIKLLERNENFCLVVENHHAKMSVLRRIVRKNYPIRQENRIITNFIQLRGRRFDVILVDDVSLFHPIDFDHLRSLAKITGASLAGFE